MEGMEQVVPARPATPPLVSLLSSVPVTVYEDPHLGMGITYEPEACADVDTLAGVCATPASLPAVPVNEGAVVATAYLVHAGDACSTMGRGERDGRGRATRLLLASQHESIERELWSGQVAQAEDYPTPFLRDASTVTDLTPASGAVTPRAALARLEQALAHCRTRPVIHASILGAYYLPEVRLDGAVWVSKKQTIVVPGAGYSGYGPGTDLAAPADLEATPAETGGTLAAGTYEYVVTTVSDSGGESLPTAEVAATTTGATGSVDLTWTAVADAASYNVYGRQSGSLLLLGNTATPDFTDTNGAAGTQTPPTVDTSGQPESNETWLFGTGLVDVRMDPVFTSPDADLEAIDRRTNHETYRAMRMAVASFDPCCHYAIRMILATDEDAVPTP